MKKGVISIRTLKIKTEIIGVKAAQLVIVCVKNMEILTSDL